MRVITFIVRGALDCIPRQLEIDGNGNITKTEYQNLKEQVAEISGKDISCILITNVIQIDED